MSINEQILVITSRILLIKKKRKTVRKIVETPKIQSHVYSYSQKIHINYKETNFYLPNILVNLYYDLNVRATIDEKLHLMSYVSKVIINFSKRQDHSYKLVTTGNRMHYNYSPII